MLGLSCVFCRSYNISEEITQYICGDCGCAFPILGGVGVMFDMVRLSTGTRPDSNTAKQILNAFEMPTDALTVERLRHVFSKKATFGGELIQVEAAQFLERVRSTGYRVDAHDENGEAPDPAPEAAGFVKPRWMLNHIPRLLPPGKEFLGNVRFENAGTASMRHEGDGRIMIAARWYDSDGEKLKTADNRTPLPLDILPGQAITLPVRFETPAGEGDFTLSLLLVEEGVRWIEDESYPIHIKVRQCERPAVPQDWAFYEEALNYDQDHQRGVAILRDWLEHFAPGHPRILEIGGNAIPMIERFDGELHNVDVDLLGLQICALRQRQAGRAMTTLCADAENLPYQAGFFDVIVIFASLHHFPDPAKLLTTLRYRLKPEGFIAVMCEPVGHMWPGAVLPEFLAELKRGVNEQSFTPEEYVQIFRSAELLAAEAVIDKNSLKARLIPKAAAR